MRFLLTVFFSLFMFGATALADDTPNNTQTPPPAETDAQKLAASLRREEELKAELAKYKQKPDTTPPPDDDDLRHKALKEKETAEEQAKQTRQIESALQFNLGVDEFVKKNSDLLPKEISDIIRVAHKETYDSAVAKANAIKASVIQAYFSIESNLEALTKSQRERLDDYLKLTKTGKESKAADIYADIFEPSFETIRKIKKAEELGRSRAGLASPSDGDAAYRDKLIKGSRRTYLNERDA